MIYAEMSGITGRLTGRWKNIKPPWYNWTEYESQEEFQADLAIDRHDTRHFRDRPDPNCEWCKSEGWVQ